jgi:hypothetical protein
MTKNKRINHLLNRKIVDKLGLVKDIVLLKALWNKKITHLFIKWRLTKG